MSDKRFVTMIEKYCDVGRWKKGRYGETFEIKSLATAKAGIILSSQILEESLPQIRRIFTAPIPIIYIKINFSKRWI